MILSGLRNIKGSQTAIFVVAVIAALTMMSCGHDSPDAPTGDDQSGVVAFRVLTPKALNSKTISRATWGDNYDNNTGNEFETSIIRNQLYVFITDASCTEQYSVINLVCTKTSETLSAVVYEYTGRVDKDDLPQVNALTDAKLHVVANAGYRPALSEATTFARGGLATDFDAIPMWGVMKADFSKLSPEKSINVGDVHLLRAMAKIVIENGSDPDNFIKTLKSVTISRTNPLGHLVPGGWSTVTSTKEIDRSALHIPQQYPTDPKTYSFTNNIVEIYLPEIENPSYNEIELELTVETTSGEEREGTLYLRPYKENGDPDETLTYNLHRNYLYHYTVKMASNSDVKAEVQIVPYTGVWLNPDFGIDRD